MKFVFLLRFFTRPGEGIRISGNIPELGSGLPEGSVPLSYFNDQFWKLEVDIPETRFKRNTPVCYHYIFHPNDGHAIADWEMGRRLELPDNRQISSICLTDTWNHAGDVQNVFYTLPFRNVLLPQPSGDRHPVSRDATHCFRVKATSYQTDQELCLTGSANSLGSWDKGKCIRMIRTGDWWEARVNLSDALFPVTYKYAWKKMGSTELEVYEDGSNRVLERNTAVAAYSILHDGFARFPSHLFRAAGIAIPVFSLRSEKGFGIGDFGDIKLLVDWAARIGVKMVQLLPVNDTTSLGTWEDSYPYSAISAFALHPIYLNLHGAAGGAHLDLVQKLEERRSELQKLAQIDYEKVIQLKNAFIDELSTRISADIFQSEGYASFFENNRHWLVPYAAFCYLRDTYRSSDTSTWQTHSVYNAKAIAKMCTSGAKQFPYIQRVYFTQYLLHVQLQEAHEYANRKGIILKGDIPIGVNRHGVETWMEPEYFHMGMQAGAPPDDFAVKGQNWEFPTYHWDRMKRDGFSWWKRRFEQMSRYFDAFRIDHILGFFRIWSIPIDAVEGIMGHFVPAIPVKKEEFESRGIRFDLHRFCRPWITDEVLWEMLGPKHVDIRPYLHQLPNGNYALKDECNTQRKVIEMLSRLNLSNADDVRKSLFDLISNVIMFEESGSFGSGLHFRFNMESTASFRCLDVHTKTQLKELYVDYFFRRQDGFWKWEAMEKLPALKRCTDMLICGEDLGLVPSCVPDVMQQLGILSMEVQRMPKDSSRQFANIAAAPYLSVVTPSSHDMSTIREWWEEDKPQIQQFFTHVLGQYAAVPETCEPWISERILQQHLHSPAQWAVFQFQDLISVDPELRSANPADDRINIPSNPKHYWRYRMHISLEGLMAEEICNNKLANLIEQSGRAHVSC